jgi:hypothetical protein
LRAAAKVVLKAAFDQHAAKSTERRRRNGRAATFASDQPHHDFAGEHDQVTSSLPAEIDKEPYLAALVASS